MFYVFEGIDGSGKSTQARRFKEYLERESGGQVLEVREPGGTVLGEKVREILLDPASGELSPEVEVFLFMAARAHLCYTRIRPALDQGAMVVADRFVWSSVVYQGIVSGLGFDAVIELGRVATGGMEPDCTFLIDIDPDVAFARIGYQDRMEGRGVDFQRQVRDGYLTLARSLSDQFVVVDGRGDPEAVHWRVLGALKDRGVSAKTGGEA